MKHAYMGCVLAVAVLSFTFFTPASEATESSSSWNPVELLSSDTYVAGYSQHGGGCLVSIRKDGQAVATMAHGKDSRGRSVVQRIVVELQKDGSVTSVETFHRGKSPYEKVVGEYDIFEKNCLSSAKHGLPENVKAAFHGKYGLGSK